MGELLPIDEEKTQLKAQAILSKYRTERGYAHMPINPRVTSSWSADPVSTVSRDPYALERVQRKEAGQEYVKYIDDAIASLPVMEHQWVLTARFCTGGDSHHPDQDAIARLNDMDPMHYSIASTKYFDMRDEALLAVAYYLGCEVRLNSGEMSVKYRHKRG